MTTIFISAAKDLSRWRLDLRTALQKLDANLKIHEQEIFPAAAGNIHVRQSLEQRIDESDYIIHLAGWLYGRDAYIDEWRHFRCSLAQYEYYYAHLKNKKVIAVVCEGQLPDSSALEEGDVAEKRRLQQEHARRVSTGEFDGSPLSGRKTTVTDGAISTPSDMLKFILGCVGTILPPQPNEKPGFVAEYAPGSVPSSLWPHPGFVGRVTELKILAETVRPNSIITICGKPSVGKSALLAESLNKPETLSLLRASAPLQDTPVALLYLDLKQPWGRFPFLLRRLLYALGEGKRTHVSDYQFDTSIEEIRGETFHEILPSAVGSRLPLLVVESSDLLPEDSKKDLAALISFEKFQHGSVIMVCAFETAKSAASASKRTLKLPLNIGPMSADDASKLIASLTDDPRLASQAVAKLGNGSEELLFPINLRNGTDIFQEKIARDKTLPSDVLAACILEAAAVQVNARLEQLGCPCADLDVPQVTPLLIMAVLAKLSIPMDVLHSLGLDLTYVEKLSSARWLAHSAGCVMLPGIARDTFRHSLSSGQDGNEARLSNAVKDVANGVRHLCSKLLEDSSSDLSGTVQQCIEEALSWASEAALPGNHLIRSTLETILLNLVADDVIFPFAGEELSDLGSLLLPKADFTDALARLVIAKTTGEGQMAILEAWDTATRLVLQSDNWQAYQLRALDLTINIKHADKQKCRQVLDRRKEVAARLAARAYKHQKENGSFVYASASWLVNTADIALIFGENLEEIIPLLDLSSSLLREFLLNTKEKKSFYHHALSSRIARLRAWASPRMDARRSFFTEAAKEAETALLMSGFSAGTARFYLRAVQRLLEATPGPDHRQNWIERVERVITSLMGSSFYQWPPSVQAHFASLMRHDSSMCALPEQRLTKLDATYLKVQGAWAGAYTLADHGDGRVLLSLGRILRLMRITYNADGQLEKARTLRLEALKVAGHVIKKAPTRQAWRFRLSLIDRDSFVLAPNWEFDDISGDESEVKIVTRECRRWISEQPASPPIGELDLLCTTLLWQSQGSILRMVKRKIEGAGSDFTRISVNERIKIIDQEANIRQSYLVRIERRHGPFVKLAVAQIKNEAQRLYAHAIVRRDGKFETRSILALFEAAEIRFHESNYLRAESARFFRRIWHYGEAAIRFEHILGHSRDFKLRTEVAKDLVETLLTAVLHCPFLDLPDGRTLQRQDMLGRARELLSYDLAAFGSDLDLVILRDLIALEQGEVLDWSRLENACKEVVGDPGAYVHTVTDHFSDLRSVVVSSLEHSDDAVRTNFTHIETLRSFGRLFLRRGELALSSNRLEDFKRAYGCFDACRVLEISLPGLAKRELAITSFCIGRTVVMASELTGLLNPFDVYIPDERYNSLLELAIAKLQSASHRSVGMFHHCVKSLCKTAQQLQKKIQSTEHFG